MVAEPVAPNQMGEVSDEFRPSICGCEATFRFQGHSLDFTSVWAFELRVLGRLRNAVVWWHDQGREEIND